MKEIVEYELLHIAFALEYEIPEDNGYLLSEDNPIAQDPVPTTIEYDANGIPMGRSKEEIKIRQQLIYKFYEEWKATNPGKAVYNNNLEVDILIRNESVVEAAAHASKRYKSTLAVLKLDEVLTNAVAIATDTPKPGNKNQEKLQSMILMSHKCPDIGTIKLTVGVRRRSLDKIQYGITALEDGETITPTNKRKNNKASHKK